MTVLLPYLNAAMGQIESVAGNLYPAPASPDLKGPGLTSSEDRIVDLIKAGKTNTEIAIILEISPVGLENQLRNIFRKL